MSDPSTFASRHFLWHVNQARRANGKPYLRRDLQLDVEARVRTNRILTDFRHDIAWVTAHNHFAVSGEILGWTSAHDSADQWLIDAFMASPEHKAVILGDWDRFGDAVVSVPDGKTYVTVLFGKGKR